MTHAQPIPGDSAVNEERRVTWEKAVLDLMTKHLSPELVSALTYSHGPYEITKVRHGILTFASAIALRSALTAEPMAWADDYIDQLNVLCEDFGCPPGSDRLGWLHDRLSSPQDHAAPEPIAETAGVLTIPREPTEEMMAAGLYQSSHDSEWEDVYSMWVDMWDVADLSRNQEELSPPTPKPEAVAWRYCEHDIDGIPWPWSYTENKELAEDRKHRGFEVEPLYASPQPLLNAPDSAPVKSDLAGCKIALEQAWASNREREAEIARLRKDLQSALQTGGDQ